MSIRVASGALLFALVAASAQDFTGTWRLQSERPERGSLPEPPAAVLEVEHSAGRVRCTSTTSGGAPESFQFTIDGNETKTAAGAKSLKVIAKWEGAALLINTIVSGPAGSYTQMDRWTMSRDRATLTIAREIVRGAGAEIILVYTRQGVAPRPAAPAAPVPAAAPVAAPAPAPAPAPASPGWRRVGDAAVPAPAPQPQPAKPAEFALEAGTRIPLIMVNSVSTKQSSEGDRIYLTTAFPVLVGGRVIVPAGSYVAGTLTFVKRPGRLRGRGEIYLRFDSLTLPNGTIRDFRSRVGSLGGTDNGQLDRDEGTIKSEGSKGKDARTIGAAGAAGASVGGLAGAAAGNAGMGVGIGAAAGAAAGVMGVLLSRGPDLVLSKGTSLEMVLDRKLVYTEDELREVRK